MEPIDSSSGTAANDTAVSPAETNNVLPEIKGMAEDRISSFETNIGEVSPIKTKEVSDFIKTKIDHQELRNNSLKSITDSIQKSSEGYYTDGRNIKYNFEKDLSIIKNEIRFKGEKFGTIDEKTRSIQIDREKGLNSKGINTFLSHTTLAPNASYDVTHGLNKTIYNTDGIGRCKSIIDVAKETGNARCISEQVKALRTKNEQTIPNTDYRINDQSGHYIASRNGGIPESINLFPQAYKLNNSKEFKYMEKTINTAIDAGLTVKTSIEVNYQGLSFRPDSLVYKVEIDGEKMVRYKYENTNHTQKELSGKIGYPSKN